jgi:hypothetical protein
VLFLKSCQLQAQNTFESPLSYSSLACSTDACQQLQALDSADLSLEQAEDARQALEALDVSIRELLPDLAFLNTVNCSQSSDQPLASCLTNGTLDANKQRVNLEGAGPSLELAQLAAVESGLSESRFAVNSHSSDPSLYINTESKEQPHAESSICLGHSLPLAPLQGLLYSPLAWVRAAGWFSFSLCIDAGLHQRGSETGLSLAMTEALVRAVDGVGGDLECYEALFLLRKLIASKVQLPKALLKAVVALASVPGTGSLETTSPSKSTASLETGPSSVAKEENGATAEKLTADAFENWDSGRVTGRLPKGLKDGKADGEKLTANAFDDWDNATQIISKDLTPGVKGSSSNQDRSRSPSRTPVTGRPEEASRSRGASNLSVVSYASASGYEPASESSSGRASTSIDASVRGASSTDASRTSSTGPGQIFPLEGADFSRSRGGSGWSDTRTGASEGGGARSRNASVKSSSSGYESDWTDTVESGAARSREASVNSDGKSRGDSIPTKQSSFQSALPTANPADSKRFQDNTLKEEKSLGPKWESVGLLISLISTGQSGALLVAQNRGLFTLLHSLQECPGSSEALRLTISASIALLLSDPVCRKACSQGLSGRQALLAPLVSPFLDAAIAGTEMKGSSGAESGTDSDEKEVLRVLKGSGEALLAVARSWGGILLLGEMRSGKRNGGTERRQSLLGDLVAALRVTKSQAVKGEQHLRFSRYDHLIKIARRKNFIGFVRLSHVCIYGRTHIIFCP